MIIDRYGNAIMGDQDDLFIFDGEELDYDYPTPQQKFFKTKPYNIHSIPNIRGKRYRMKGGGKMSREGVERALELFGEKRVFKSIREMVRNAMQGQEEKP